MFFDDDDNSGDGSGGDDDYIKAMVYYEKLWIKKIPLTHLSKTNIIIILLYSFSYIFPKPFLDSHNIYVSLLPAFSHKMLKLIFSKRMDRIKEIRIESVSLSYSFPINKMG
jgi:hypothetical protein